MLGIHFHPGLETSYHLQVFWGVMPTDEEFRELKDRVLAMEEQIELQNQYLTEILRQIPEIPERGMARFDAVTWESPSAVHTVYLNIRKLAKKGPDGYTTREEVKGKAAADHDMLKTEVKGYIEELVEGEVVIEHPGDSSRVKPNPEVSDIDASDLFVSNFDRADERREKAESRGKRRDRRR